MPGLIRLLARQWPVRIQGKREETHDIKSDHGSCADDIDARDRRALRRDPPAEASGRPRHQPIEQSDADNVANEQRKPERHSVAHEQTIWDRSTDIGDMDNRLFDPFTGLGAAAGCRNGATVQESGKFQDAAQRSSGGFPIINCA